MKTLAAVLRIGLISLTILGGSACKKTDPDDITGVSFVGSLPYYHFTESDNQWFGTAPGTVWTFENGQGGRRRYTVSVRQHLQVENNKRIPGIFSDSYKLVSYSDQAVLNLANVDASSSDTGGRFEFYTDPTVTSDHRPVSGQSRLYAKANWFAFMGPDKVITDYYYPNGNQLNGPFQQLTVRGLSYAEVALFSVTPRASYLPPSLPTSISVLHYDHQRGLIRLVTQAGEVWDRVP